MLQLKIIKGLPLPTGRTDVEPHDFQSWWNEMGQSDAAFIPDSYWAGRGDTGRTYEQYKTTIRNNFLKWRDAYAPGTPQWDKTLAFQLVKKGSSPEASEEGGIRVHMRVIPNRKKKPPVGAAAAQQKAKKAKGKPAKKKAAAAKKKSTATSTFALPTGA